MSDDWLQHGHETDGVELVPVLSTSSVLDDRARVSSRPRWASGWRAVMAGGTIALFAALGVVGVANAISDNLFPSMGPASPASVWQNPVPASEPVTTTVATSSTVAEIRPTVPSTTAPAPASTIAPAVASPTTSAPKDGVDHDDGDVAATTTNPGDDVPDDRIEDSSGSSSGSGSGRDDSDDSGSSGSSGSGKSGSDDSRDSDDD